MMHHHHSVNQGTHMEATGANEGGCPTAKAAVLLLALLAALALAHPVLADGLADSALATLNAHGTWATALTGATVSEQMGGQDGGTTDAQTSWRIEAPAPDGADLGLGTLIGTGIVGPDSIILQAGSILMLGEFTLQPEQQVTVRFGSLDGTGAMMRVGSYTGVSLQGLGTITVRDLTLTLLDEYAYATVELTGPQGRMLKVSITHPEAYIQHLATLELGGTMFSLSKQEAKTSISRTRHGPAGPSGALLTTGGGEDELWGIGTGGLVRGSNVRMLNTQAKDLSRNELLDLLERTHHPPTAEQDITLALDGPGSNRPIEIIHTGNAWVTPPVRGIIRWDIPDGALTHCQQTSIAPEECAPCIGAVRQGSPGNRYCQDWWQKWMDDLKAGGAEGGYTIMVDGRDAARIALDGTLSQQEEGTYALPERLDSIGDSGIALRLPTIGGIAGEKKATTIAYLNQLTQQDPYAGHTWAGLNPLSLRPEAAALRSARDIASALLWSMGTADAPRIGLLGECTTSLERIRELLGQAGDSTEPIPTGSLEARCAGQALDAMGVWIG
ncbi:hypothetical protein COY28_02305 [Candidatus Woesearchaeota archaeon CG_4_10_14_0_2_um_filter_57_5]|nr:MAG: hypothetical protein COV94_07285 [Candidatus Woesearchaeota archaeon CG11_big_fil_rev_8_21_14_0_20_57_5]PIZ54921.1 MAG: hypothetical protein COY28_02305 [Candidatus Woesearchaeota archaeon CG_4_10_14_0_2_um_filter_57_5]